MSLKPKLDKITSKTGGDSNGIALMQFKSAGGMFDTSGQVKDIEAYRELPDGRVQLKTGEVCKKAVTFQFMPFTPKECPEAAMGAEGEASSAV